MMRKRLCLHVDSTFSYLYTVMTIFFFGRGGGGGGGGGLISHGWGKKIDRLYNKYKHRPRLDYPTGIPLAMRISL